jgi:hypothetical protein
MREILRQAQDDTEKVGGVFNAMVAMWRGFWLVFGRLWHVSV